MRIPLAFLCLAAPASAFADEPAAPAPAASHGPHFEVATGVEYEEGDYGTDSRIKVTSVPVSLKLASGRLQVVAALPHRRVEGPANVVPGGGPGLPLLFGPAQPQQERTVREGLGDLEIGASYAVPVKAVNLALSGSVKLPTAAAGLGTGKTDYTLGADLSKALPHGIVPFASVDYTLPGSPDGIALQDSYAVAGGVAARLGTRAQAYVSYRYAENASALAASDQRLVTGLDSRLGKAVSLGLYGSAGMAEGAPAFTTGLRLGLALN